MSKNSTSGFGFWVSGLGFRITGSGFRVSGFGSGVEAWVSGFGFWVSGFGFRASSFGLRSSGFGLGPDFWDSGLGFRLRIRVGPRPRAPRCPKTTLLVTHPQPRPESVWCLEFRVWGLGFGVNVTPGDSSTPSSRIWFGAWSLGCGISPFKV